MPLFLKEKESVFRTGRIRDNRSLACPGLFTARHLNVDEFTKAGLMIARSGSPGPKKGKTKEASIARVH